MVTAFWLVIVSHFFLCRPKKFFRSKYPSRCTEKKLKKRQRALPAFRMVTYLPLPKTTMTKKASAGACMVAGQFSPKFGTAKWPNLDIHWSCEILKPVVRKRRRWRFVSHQGGTSPTVGTHFLAKLRSGGHFEIGARECA